MYQRIGELRGEPKAVAEIKMRRGGPRLLLNGEEIFPLLAWSWKLAESAPLFRDAGIKILHPILGLNAAWPVPERFDFSVFDRTFDALLAVHPEAFFLPRVLLDVPLWWKAAYPEEMIRCGLPPKPEDDRQYRAVRLNEEGGWLWGIQMNEPSPASPIWKGDLEKLYRAFLRYIENSPLRSRVFGYQFGSGIYGEWHYFLSEFVPDYSPHIERTFGPVPSVEKRIKTTAGLLRDPRREKDVIEFYRRFHVDFWAETILRFARITREETDGKALSGTFYGYQLENVWMQEGGHLAPEKILTSSDLDFIAGPYTYQTTNIEGRPWWSHDVTDEAGNEIGRARGIGGDGGYRVLLESLHRHGKIYFVELDAGTFLEPPPVNEDGSGGSDVEKEQCMVGGEGSTEREGSLQILNRDLGRMLVTGAAGWLFDFGPVLRTGKSWYNHKVLQEEVRKFADWGKTRMDWDLSSFAEAAAVYEAKSFFATRHWRGEAPFSFGGHSLDYFTRWFMDSQARAFHRLGAPLDFLYRFDLEEKDRPRYKLLFMTNLFYLTDDEVKRLKVFLRDSGMTVVWFYAPGYIAPDSLNPARMEDLTGFRFHRIDEPGPMLIQMVEDSEREKKIRDGDRESVWHQVKGLDGPGENGMEGWGGVDVFGTSQPQWPRFVINDPAAQILGLWQDGIGPAFAVKEVEGFTSVYVGAAPLPPSILRTLAQQAGVSLWSSKPDIVVASNDATMFVATSNGERTFTLPQPMREVPLVSGKDQVHQCCEDLSGPVGCIGAKFTLALKFGDVRFFFRDK